MINAWSNVHFEYFLKPPHSTVYSNSTLFCSDFIMRFQFLCSYSVVSFIIYCRLEVTSYLHSIYIRRVYMFCLLVVVVMECVYRLNSIFIWWGRRRRRKKNGYEIRQLQKHWKILCCIVFYFETIFSFVSYYLSFLFELICTKECVYVSCISKQSVKVQWEIEGPCMLLYVWRHISSKWLW